MKFTEMPYKRPDGAKLMEETERLAEKVRDAGSADEILALIREYDRMSEEFSTQYNIAYIRNTIDTRDEFYDAEKNFYDEFLPEFLRV